MILLDTNVLGRMTDSTDPQYPTVHLALRKYWAQKETLTIVPQNIYEFWAMATRAAGQNGMGMSCEGASQWLNFFQRRFRLLADKEDLVPQWYELVRTHEVVGLKSHDARLVAAMQTHGIERLLTFNGDDFKKFGVTVIDPATV